MPFRASGCTFVSPGSFGKPAFFVTYGRRCFQIHGRLVIRRPVWIPDRYADGEPKRGLFLSAGNQSLSQDVQEVKRGSLEEHEDYIRPLLRGCLEGHRVSQKLLYQEYYGYGMSVSLRYATNRDEASEILNDAFMKMFTNLKKFDLTKPFKPWLRRILINTAINHYNKKQREIPLQQMKNAKYESDSEKILSGIAYQEVIGLLQKLPPAYRTVFNLYVIEGYSHEEIAGMLHIATGTSKSNLFKAREQLKLILSDFFHADYAGTR